MKKLSSIKGFTLIELMVVIVILGILAAVIAPRVPQFVNKAKEGKTKGNLGTLRSALNIYYSDNEGSYPTDNLASMTVGSKYLKEMPQMETAAFPGITNTHKHGPTNTVTKADGATDLSGDNGGWYYQNVNTQSDWGSIWVNCSGVDSASRQWTSY